MSPPTSARSGWLQHWLMRLRPGAGAKSASPATELPAPDLARQSLKAAVARRRRNERVRNDELNRLRELMQAQSLASGVASSSPQSGLGDLSELPSAMRSASGATDARSRTIEQIARIESQMAQHWGGRSNPSGAAFIGAQRLAQALDGPLTRSIHLQTRKPSALPIDLVPTEPRESAHVLANILTHPTLAQAAQGFAQGHDAVAERGLRALMAQEPLSLTARVAALTLLDLYHARADFEAFDEFAAEFAERFGVPVPRWPGSPQTPAGPAAVTGPHHDTGRPAPASDTWICPLLLDASAVASLARLLAAPGNSKCLDFTGLLSADLSAAQALLAQAEAWNQRSIELRIVGSAVLRRRLKASTPSGRNENDPVWWLLRLSLLRTLRRRDEFDLVALDYCVTYGELPPVWELPRCRCVSAHDNLAQVPDAASARLLHQTAPSSPELARAPTLDWPSIPTALTHSIQDAGPDTHSADWPSAVTELAPDWPALSGNLRGDCSATWAELERALPRQSDAGCCAINCNALLRVDFVAASGLMQTLLAARQRGLELELHGLSRLLAAYFHALGIDEVATLHLRHY